MINNIEKNVMNATDYVEHAKEETKKAIKYQSKARRVSLVLKNWSAFFSGFGFECAYIDASPLKRYSKKWKCLTLMFHLKTEVILFAKRFEVYQLCWLWTLLVLSNENPLQPKSVSLLFSVAWVPIPEFSVSWAIMWRDITKLMGLEVLKTIGYTSYAVSTLFFVYVIC